MPGAPSQQDPQTPARGYPGDQFREGSFLVSVTSEERRPLVASRQGLAVGGPKALCVRLGPVIVLYLPDGACVASFSGILSVPGSKPNSFSTSAAVLITLRAIKYLPNE